ncbi:MAG: hypothetical protein H6729_09955 [Deltaproteobacteria bacterium]|nr:hypothetical protein [Deltaproteobacteria bacterium]
MNLAFVLLCGLSLGAASVRPGPEPELGPEPGPVPLSATDSLRATGTATPTVAAEIEPVEPSASVAEASVSEVSVAEASVSEASVAEVSVALHKPSVVPQKRRRVVVQTLKSPDDLTLFARDLSEDVVVHLGTMAEAENLFVLSEAEVDLMMKHASESAELSTEDCRRAEACLARISEAAEADLVVFGRLGRLGDSYVAVLSLLNVDRAQVERAETCTGQTKKELSASIPQALNRLFGIQANESEHRSASASASASRTGSGSGSASGSTEETVAHTMIDSAAMIAVVPITGLEDQPSIASTLTQILGLEIRRYEYSVQTRDELLTMLHYAVNRHELQKSEIPLDEVLIEIAGSMGVDYLTTGNVGALDETTVIILKLIDIHEAKVVERIAESYRGPLEHLPTVMRFATARLLGRTIEGQGDLAIVTNAEGNYRVDQDLHGPLQAEVTSVEKLSASKHRLQLQAEGFYPYVADVFIDPSGDQPIRFKPELVEIPTPWYKTGLFWGLTGTVVAGVTTAVLLATLPPKGSAGNGEF